MMKTAAIFIAVVLSLFIFQAHVKSATMQMQMSWTLSNIEMEEDTQTAFSRTFSRVGKGYTSHKFDDTEKITLRKLMAELDKFEDKEIPAAEADRLLRKFEAILDRHQL